MARFNITTYGFGELAEDVVGSRGGRVYGHPCRGACVAARGIRAVEMKKTGCKEPMVHIVTT